MKHVLLVLSCFFVLMGMNAQGRLVIKCQADFRNDFLQPGKELREWWIQTGLSFPTRIFPTHQEPAKAHLPFGRKPVDLSLLYELELPAAPSPFLLRQLKQRPEFAYAEWLEASEMPLYQPNDPFSDSTSGSQRQLWKRIQAYQGWNLSQGDTSVLIGVLDTGIPVDHPDMRSQIKINPLDPPNGLDDDQNGLIDDYRGWDFGANDNNPTPDNTGIAPGHGTSVSSLAGAAFNNAEGVAGLAGKCKILPLKIWRWNNNFSNFLGYEAIVYAADRGCKVINCSWGSNKVNNSYEQDIINYATFNKDAVVVAAGGNTTGYLNFLPANYDYVVGVSMTDTSDNIVANTSLNGKLDLMAPGVGLFSIKTDNSYGWIDGGSSMASPLVAAAIGLVRSRFPQLSGLQAAELVRVSSDSVYQRTANQNFRDLAGRGRLNVYRALQSPQAVSLRPAEIQVRHFRTREMGYQAGDTLLIRVRFENYLDSVSGFQARLSVVGNQLQLIDSTVSVPGIGTLQSAWAEEVFLVRVNPGFSGTAALPLWVRTQAGSYTDRRRFDYRLDLRYIELDANLVRMTVPQNGRLGSLDISNTIGSGIRYRGFQQSGDAGLLLGTAANRVSNCVYDTTANDAHFRNENPIRFTNYPGLDQHAQVHLNDSAAGSARIGVGVKSSFYEMDVDSLQGTVFLNYQVQNRTNQAFDSLCVGLYNDWEVENLNANFSFWNDSLRFGATRGRAFRTRFAATQLLSPGEPQFYAVDALPNTNNGNINLFDGFSLAEKWKCLSSGLGRTTAGLGLNGNNVVQVVGVKLRNMGPGEIRKVTFAFVFADSLSELVQRAKANRSFFRILNQSPSPAPLQAAFCEGDSAAIPNTPTATIIKVSADSAGNQLVYQGSGFAGWIRNDSTLFVSGADSLFPGPTVKWNWRENPLPLVNFNIQPSPQNDSLMLDSLYRFTPASFPGTQSWTLDGAPLPNTDSLLNFTFTQTGPHTLCLEQTDTLTQCTNKICREVTVYQVVGTRAIRAGLPISLYPNPATDQLSLVSPEPIRLRCTGNLGQVIFETALPAGKNRVDIRQLPAGLYQLQAMGENRTAVIRFRKD
jgi:hypothetical protein